METNLRIAYLTSAFARPSDTFIRTKSMNSAATQTI